MLGNIVHRGGWQSCPLRRSVPISRAGNTPVRKIDNNRRTRRMFRTFFRKSSRFPSRHGRRLKNCGERTGADAIFLTKIAQHWMRRPRFLAEGDRRRRRVPDEVCRSTGRYNIHIMCSILCVIILCYSSVACCHLARDYDDLGAYLFNCHDYERIANDIYDIYDCIIIYYCEYS